jgi:nitroreductase
MTDLSLVLERFGNRGYRAAQLEAGIVGGKLYLAAYSLGLGASGITFYDDEAVGLFGPHSTGKDVMFVITLGKTAPQNRVRPFRSRVAVRLDAQARGAGPG